ncbi:hypothetical protein GCM10010276_16770 [Streptomyces longisporus]|uniref:Uncharacterized protein n=1 Tax=Streptomyces longisporus TaxID=1948 RepID=A0ABP5YID7_STRLO
MAKEEPRYTQTAQAWPVHDAEARSAAAPYGGGDAEAVERRRQRAMSVSPGALPRLRPRHPGVAYGASVRHPQPQPQPQGGSFTERSK